MPLSIKSPKISEDRRERASYNKLLTSIRKLSIRAKKQLPLVQCDGNKIIPKHFLKQKYKSDVCTFHKLIEYQQ